MRVAVVGATGILGRSLVPLLVKQRDAVRILAKNPEKARNFGVETASLDLLSHNAEDRLPALLRDCDAVMHLATSIPRDPGIPNAWEANTRLRTEGTRRLLEAALAGGATKYIQQSITMAYRDRGDEWLYENAPLDDSQARASITAPVREMETMVRAIPPSKLSWTILRGGSFVGSGTAQDDLIARLRSGHASVPCDGRNYISLIRVEDMATAVLAALQAQAGTIFNIVDEPLRNGDYMDRLASKYGAPPPRRDEASARPPSWRCSNRAAREKLGWAPIRDILGD